MLLSHAAGRAERSGEIAGWFGERQQEVSELSCGFFLSHAFHLPATFPGQFLTLPYYVFLQSVTVCIIHSALSIHLGGVLAEQAVTPDD